MERTVARLVAAYQRIGIERMQDVPVCNPRLCVEAVGFRHWEGRFVGALIAPWFINLVVLPTEREDWQQGAVGSQVELYLPSGNYQFDLCLADEVGVHLSLPLFSTVQDFPDQITARAVGEETVRGLFDESQREDSGRGEDRGDRRRLTRRALLGGTEGT